MDLMSEMTIFRQFLPDKFIPENTFYAPEALTSIITTIFFRLQDTKGCPFLSNFFPLYVISETILNE